MDGTGPPEPYWITRPSGHETIGASAHLSIAPKRFRSRVMVRWPTPGDLGGGRSDLFAANKLPRSPTGDVLIY